MYGFLVLPGLASKGGTAPITVNVEKIVCIAKADNGNAIIQLENMALAVDMTVKEVTDALNEMFEGNTYVWVAPEAYAEKEPKKVIMPEKKLELLH